MYKVVDYCYDGSPATDTVVIDAPNPGVAIEMFLACHGMLHYYLLMVTEVEGPASPGFTREDVHDLFRVHELAQTEWETIQSSLDRYHVSINNHTPKDVQ